MFGMIKKAGLMAAAAFLCAASAFPASAADTEINSADTAFLRAKLTMVNEDGLTDLTEDLVKISDEENWVRMEDGYYYYRTPLEDGATVEFISGFHVPEEWNDDDRDKKFRIVVTAEAAENMDNTANWSDGSISLSQSEITYTKRHLGTKVYETTGLDVDINEYELDKDGNLIPYVNNKAVLPGEDVDKIVKLTVHTTSKYTTKGDSDREKTDSDDDDDDGDSSVKSDRSTDIIPLGGGSDTQIIPINQGNAGTWIRKIIPTGDTSLMIPMAVAAVVAAAVLILLLPKKKKQDKKPNKETKINE